MQANEIKAFLESNADSANPYIKIDFKTRESTYGIFLTGGADYNDLASKNFWRIVTKKNFDAYKASANQDLAKIFNGLEFTRLSLLNDNF